jgi:hypothetical protein
MIEDYQWQSLSVVAMPLGPEMDEKYPYRHYQLITCGEKIVPFPAPTRGSD